MVDVDKLTDAELRTKLLEFGFPVMPITGTTRKVMSKKLKMLMDNRSKISANEDRKSMGDWSSCDEENGKEKEERATKKKDNRRATMAAPVMQPPTSRSRRSNSRLNDSDPEPSLPTIRGSPKKETKTVLTTSRSSKMVRSAQDDFDTGSDSESDIIVKSTNNTEFRASPIKSAASSFSSSFASSKYSPTKSPDTPYSRNSTARISSAFTAASERPLAGSSASDYASERLNQIRSRLSLNNSHSYERPVSSSTISTSKFEERASRTFSGHDSSIGGASEEETPFLSNFTRRLSSMGASKTRDYDYKNDQVIKEQDSNGSSGYAPIRSQLASYRASRGRDTTYDYRATAQNGIVKNNFVSFSVLAGVSLFFIFLAIAYLGMRTDTSVVPAGFTMASCRSDSKPGVNCVPERDAADAIYLLNAVQVELTRRAVANVCERRDGDGASPTTRSAMTEDEIVDFCLDNFGIKDDIKIRKDLRNLEILTYSNPQWNIRIVQTLTKNVVPTKDDQISNMEQVIFNKDKKVTSLVIFDADLPWMCRMTNIVYFLLNSAVFLVVTFALLYSLNYGYKHYKHQQQKQKEELGLMLERIIEILQTSATEEGENYVVINHIRDMILPVQDRQTKEKTWNKAVQFINENESRVRTEVQNVQGEPYEVWRWIGSATLGLSSSPRNNKSWQGQAFETQAGSVNGLQCSPTPCLKIRGMAEEVEGGGQAGEAQRAIREAVLGKCAHQCRILHCAVDAHSSCVYLKCADQADAAVAYRNLHGWWYAGHLVTVKYLRLERYMQRFPGSPISGPPFMKAISPATDWTS